MPDATKKQTLVLFSDKKCEHAINSVLALGGILGDSKKACFA